MHISADLLLLSKHFKSYSVFSKIVAIAASLIPRLFPLVDLLFDWEVLLVKRHISA